MNHRTEPGQPGPGKGHIPTTRLSSTWMALAGGMILLAAALTFILQNLKTVTVHFVTLDWRIPLGVDLLFAVIAGGLIIACTGSLRILQLRRLARRQARRVVVVPDTAGPQAADSPTEDAGFHAGS